MILKLFISCIFALCEQHHSVTPNCLTEELKMLFYGSLLLFYEHRVCFHYQEKDMRPWVTHGDAVSDLPPDQLFLMLRSHTTNLGYPPPSQFFLVPHLFFFRHVVRSWRMNSSWFKIAFPTRLFPEFVPTRRMTHSSNRCCTFPCLRDKCHIFSIFQIRIHYIIQSSN